jgi:hypothetical protein
MSQFNVLPEKQITSQIVLQGNGKSSFFETDEITTAHIQELEQKYSEALQQISVCENKLGLPEIPDESDLVLELLLLLFSEEEEENQPPPDSF